MRLGGGLAADERRAAQRWRAHRRCGRARPASARASARSARRVCCGSPSAAQPLVELGRLARDRRAPRPPCASPAIASACSGSSSSARRHAASRRSTDVCVSLASSSPSDRVRARAASARSPRASASRATSRHASIAAAGLLAREDRRGHLVHGRIVGRERARGGELVLRARPDRRAGARTRRRAAAAAARRARGSAAAARARSRRTSSGQRCSSASRSASASAASADAGSCSSASS